MKIHAIFLACSLPAHAALADAASCRPLEYAEIKDSKTVDLVKTYCYYGAMWKIHNDARAEANRVFLEQMKQYANSVPLLEAAQRNYLRNDAAQAADQSGCSDQQAKIAAALKARGARRPFL